jgi:hypothetical protein
MGHSIMRSRWKVTLELPDRSRVTQLVLAESSGEAMRVGEREHQMRTGQVARAIDCSVDKVGVERGR